MGGEEVKSLRAQCGALELSFGSFRGRADRAKKARAVAFL